MWTPKEALEFAHAQAVHPSENYFEMCDHFVASCYGFAYSGYTTAAAHAATLNLHSSGTPVAGAAVFWGGGAGHVALADGRGNIYSNDILVNGRISFVPQSLIEQKWGKPYLGWAPPVPSTFHLSGGVNPYWHPPVPVVSATPGSTTDTKVSSIQETISEDSMPTGSVPSGFGADVTGSVHDSSKAVMVGLFGKNTGSIGNVTLQFFCDFGKAKVRVAVHAPAGWQIEELSLDSTLGPASVALPDGATHASVVRMPFVVGDTLDSVPVGFQVSVFGK